MSANSQAISDLMVQIDALIPANIKAVVPGAGTAELSERLKARERPAWHDTLSIHSKNRAAELCHVFKDGDLLYRTGEYLWIIFWPEIDNALKLAGCSPERPRGRRPFLSIAEAAFVAEVDAIRIKRLGPEDQRHLLDPDSLEWTPPFFEKHGA